MAVSFSRPDPASPAAVASAAFSTGRRGFDQDEVRDFLRMVSAELSRLQERERFLARELVTAQSPARLDHMTLDEETVTRLLGEEAAKVLAAARDAALSIRTKAEEGASRLLREAQDEAASIREQADLEAARKRQDAAHDAAIEMDQARQRGKDMVEEAREYREKVLADLGRRRELARQQIGQLTQSRDRLVSAYERARLVAVDVLSEVSELGGDEPDLDPPAAIEPLPVIARQERPLAERVAIFESEPAPDTYAAGPRQAPAESANSVVEIVEIVEAVQDVEIAVEVVEIVEIIEADGQFELVEIEAGEQIEFVAQLDEDLAGDGLEPSESAAPPLASVIALFGDSSVDEPVEPAPVEPEAAVVAAQGSVDDLFAKLRASRIEQVARDVLEARPLTIVGGADEFIQSPTVVPAVAPAAEVAPASETDTDGVGNPGSPTEERAVVVSALAASIGRSLKRVLADEQNDVLALLRRKDPVRSLDVLIPWEGDHIDQYVVAIADETVGAIDVATERIASNVIRPLRAALKSALDQLGADNQRVAAEARTIYRDIKNQVIDAEAQSIAEHCTVTSTG